MDGLNRDRVEVLIRNWKFATKRFLEKVIYHEKLCIELIEKNKEEDVLFLLSTFEEEHLDNIVNLVSDHITVLKQFVVDFNELHFPIGLSDSFSDLRKNTITDIYDIIKTITVLKKDLFRSLLKDYGYVLDSLIKLPRVETCEKKKDLKKYAKKESLSLPSPSVDSFSS